MNDFVTLLNRRPDLETVLGRSVWTSVLVNNMFIPAAVLQTRLNSFGRNLALFTHDADHEVQLIGSASGLNYRGRRFLVSTAHQVKDRSGEDIGIIFPGENTYITSAGYSRYTPSDTFWETDAADLCAFDFTPQAMESTALAQRFFELNSKILGGNEAVIAYLAYGCPYADQKFDRR